MLGNVSRSAFLLVFPILAALVFGCSAPAVAPTPTRAPAPPTAAPAPSKAPAPTTAPAAPAPTAAKAPAPTAAPTKAPAPTVAPTAAPAAKVTLEFFGQSTFLLTGSKGTRLLMDPANASTGYDVKPFSGVDVVTVSHEHADHNNVALAQGSPTVIRGLKDGDWAKVDQTVKEIKLTGLPTFHDPEKGAKRGKNTVFMLEVDGLRIVHLGDLGHPLSPEQAAALGKVDMLMIPVGGFYTVDAAEATGVVGQLSPKIVVPMHFKTPKVSPQSPLAPVDAFLEGKKVEKLTGNKLEISKDKLPASTTVYLLGYES